MDKHKELVGSPSLSHSPRLVPLTSQANTYDLTPYLINHRGMVQSRFLVTVVVQAIFAVWTSGSLKR